MTKALTRIGYGRGDAKGYSFLMTDAKADTDLQRPVSSLPDEMWDVIIVGAGPAGSTAAIHLARGGHRVLLLDKERFPRDKVCADGLVADAIRCLRRAGLYDTVRAAAQQADRAVVFSPSRHTFKVPGEYLVLKRREFDCLIAREAAHSGAVFCHGAIDEIQIESNGSVRCSVSGDDLAVRSRIGVVATGARVGLLKRLGMLNRPRASAVAVRCYIRSSYTIDHLIVSYDRSIIPGYAWIFPLGNNVYNLGCGVFFRDGSGRCANLRTMLDVFGREFPPARNLVQDGEQVSPLRGAPLRCGLKGTKPLGEGNLLAIGETIGATLPFSGEGIGKAMETGELAAEVIHEALDSGDLGRLREYPARLRKGLEPRYLAQQVADDWLSKAWLNDLVLRRARRSKYLTDSLTGILNESVDPRKVFSLYGMLRSFWG